MRLCSVPKESDASIKPWPEWTGWIPSLIAETAKEAGFTYTLQLSSSSATTAYGASDKEVVFAKTRTNETTQTFGSTEQGGFGTGPPNVHWAGAYVTAPRLDSFEMTASFATAPLSLMVKKHPPHWSSRLKTIVQPINYQLWVVVLVFIAVAAVWSLIIRRNNSGSLKGQHDENGEAVLFDPCSVDAFQDAIYRSIMSFLVQDLWPYKKVQGKIFAMGWTFWVLIITTAYTANLARYLSADSYSLKPSSILQFLSHSPGGSPYKACVLEGSAYAKFLQDSPKYGSIRQYPCKGLGAMVTGNEREHMAEFNVPLSGLANGDCDGIIERHMVSASFCLP